MTAEKETVDKFIAALQSNPVKSIKAAMAKSGSDYCGWHENIMNQFFRIKKFDIDKVQSIQIEIRKKRFRDEDNFEITASALAHSLSKLDYGAKLVSAVQKRAVEEIKAGEIDLKDDKFKARIDDIRSNGPKFNDLVETIRKNGILNNIIVRRRKSTDRKKYQLISGFRRITALQASIPKDDFENYPVEARVFDESLTDHEAYKLSFTENLARQDLSLWEIARTCLKIKEQKVVEDKKNSGDIEKLLGGMIQKDTRTVRRYLKLASINSEGIKKAIHEGVIQPTTALDLGSKELDEKEITALLEHLKKNPKTTREFRQFYENLEYCSDKSEKPTDEVLECRNSDIFLSLDQEELKKRVENLHKKSQKPYWEVLQGKAGPLNKDLPDIDSMFDKKKEKGQFKKETTPLEKKISESFEDLDIKAKFKINKVLVSGKEEIEITLTAPVEKIQDAIRTVSGFEDEFAKIEGLMKGDNKKKSSGPKEAETMFQMRIQRPIKRG